jgi:hypothetical protein
MGKCFQKSLSSGPTDKQTKEISENDLKNAYTNSYAAQFLPVTAFARYLASFQSLFVITTGKVPLKNNE